MQDGRQKHGTGLFYGPMQSQIVASFWGRNIVVSPCQLWMYVFDVASLVPAVPSWALTNCTEKHEPCLAKHTHITNRLSWALGWWEAGKCNHVAYLGVVLCRIWALLCSCLLLPTKVSQWEVTTQSDCDWNNFTADRKLKLALQGEWVGQASWNIFIAVIWEAVLNQRARHLSLYLLTEFPLG